MVYNCPIVPMIINSLDVIYKNCNKFCKLLKTGFNIIKNWIQDDG